MHPIGPHARGCPGEAKAATVDSRQAQGYGMSELATTKIRPASASNAFRVAWKFPQRIIGLYQNPVLRGELGRTVHGGNYAGQANS